jgi:hypothetical protein
MKRRHKLYIWNVITVLCLLSAGYFFMTMDKCWYFKKHPWFDRFHEGKSAQIAHAGGMVKGLMYSNTLQALDENYKKGMKIFEIDLQKTSDGKWVAVHGWGDKYYVELTGKKWEGKIPTYDEFMSQKLKHDLTALDLRAIAVWLANHKDAFIVTDVKGENSEILPIIARLFPEYINRIVPEVFSMNEVGLAVDLGFNQFILSLYRGGFSEKEILKYPALQKIFGVAMPDHVAKGSDLACRLRNKGAFVYIHAGSENSDIDSAKTQKLLIKRGASGFYVDDYTNHRCKNLRGPC